jgi:soluble lytic murein transglycosylase-like protein
MSTGNYLTIRDYFDRALAGSVTDRKVFSTGKTASTDSSTFQQLLTSLGNQPLNHNDPKPAGLTVIDYLSNPVRANCRYKLRGLPAASEKNQAAADKVPASPADRPATESAAATAYRPQAKKNPLPAVESSAVPSIRGGSQESRIIEHSIRKAARKYNLQATLLRGVIRAESNFQVDAVSHAGAQGLMQLMPGTARELGVDNPFDIEQNIDGGARYLRQMLDNFGGDVKVALAAYNAGPGAVEKYGGQIPPYQETEQYINRVLRFSKQAA